MTKSDWLALIASGDDIDTSIAAADARFTLMGEDMDVIPKGCACYSRMTQKGTTDKGLPIFKTTPCPFWASKPDAPEQQWGYCALLGCGDFDEDGTILLWDQTKECGLNYGDEEDI